MARLSVFLTLFRLFQVVGKIDDTLALLNLVSRVHLLRKDYFFNPVFPGEGKEVLSL